MAHDDYMDGIKRYFLVIRELHEMGYELIRVCPSVSPNGANWRCATTVKKYTLKTCGAIYRSNEAHTAANTSGGNFNWDGWTVSTFSPYICHEMMGLDAMILVF